MTFRKTDQKLFCIGCDWLTCQHGPLVTIEKLYIMSSLTILWEASRYLLQNAVPLELCHLFAELYLTAALSRRLNGVARKLTCSIERRLSPVMLPKEKRKIIMWF